MAVLRRLVLTASAAGSAARRRLADQFCCFPTFVVIAARRHERRDLLGCEGSGLDVVAGDGGGDGGHRLVGQDRPSGGFDRSVKARLTLRKVNA